MPKAKGKKKDDLQFVPLSPSRPIEEQLAELNESEREQFEKLKNKYSRKQQPIEVDDATFLKFLRARKFDANRALSMRENYNKWSLDIGLQNLSVDMVPKQLQTGT